MIEEVIVVYTVDSGDLFTFYILKPQLLTSRFDLELLIHYQILLTLNLTLYYSNCFIYTLEQYGVPSNKIAIIRSYLVDIYIKIKYIRYLDKLLKLRFNIYPARYHIKEEYRFAKLGKPENNHIIGYKSYQKPISLLIYENHLMLYDVNITFNGHSYINTWHILESLIKYNIIVRMIINEK